jgi:hypothetical protein
MFFSTGKIIYKLEMSWRDVMLAFINSYFLPLINEISAKLKPCLSGFNALHSAAGWRRTRRCSSQKLEAASHVGGECWPWRKRSLACRARWSQSISQANNRASGKVIEVSYYTLDFYAFLFSTPPYAMHSTATFKTRRQGWKWNLIRKQE